MPKFKPQHRRLLFIDKKLKEGRFPNCRTLADEWEVSIKTIQRDIEYLKYELDAPIEYDQVHRGFRYTEAQFSLPAIDISESDLFAVCIAQNAVRQFRNTPVHTKLASIFARIRDSLPDKTSVQPSWLDDRILLFPEPATHVSPEIWETLAKAIRDNKSLSICHVAPGEKRGTERKVDPYYLVNYKGEWYLSSLCHSRHSIRTFAVSRIRKAERLDESFAMPASLDKDAMFGDQFGIIWKDTFHKIRIRFTPAIAPYILERQWHATQKIQALRDGAIILEFTTNHLNEVKDWVLSWGDGAAALSPPELVSKIKTSLKNSLDAYR
jgi:predicted DNA-binding transcriptional regulator YafY